MAISCIMLLFLTTLRALKWIDWKNALDLGYNFVLNDTNLLAKIWFKICLSVILLISYG